MVERHLVCHSTGRSAGIKNQCRRGGAILKMKLTTTVLTKQYWIAILAYQEYK